MAFLMKRGNRGKTQTRSHAFGNRLNAFESRLNAFVHPPLSSERSHMPSFTLTSLLVEKLACQLSNKQTRQGENLLV